MPSRIKYRRSISMSPETYVRWRRFCERFGVSMSGQLERQLNHVMDESGCPRVTHEEAVMLVKKGREKYEAPKREAASGIFTF
jgi:hypothetical protein